MYVNGSIYNKKDAVMTRGFAILCMVVLHLFCRKGANVYGTPLVWINRDTPFVYWFGFYSEICVSMYSICMGYAQYLLYSKGKATWYSTWKRILKIMVNYWVILVMFSIIGLLYSIQKAIPGSFSEFLKSIVLLHSYNGAWWFLNTYILFLLIPNRIKYLPIEKLPIKVGILFCLAFQVGWYFINKLGFWPMVSDEHFLSAFILKELKNLIGVLPSAWVGAYLCKGNAVTRTINYYHSKIIKCCTRKLVLGCIWCAIFIVMNIVHKAAITIVFAILSFLLFNIWEKGALAEKIWLFLGKHSTNIWLTHMFFYATLFTGFVQKVKYPLAMLGFILVLCIFVSYIEMAMEKMIKEVFQLKI